MELGNLDTNPILESNGILPDLPLLEHSEGCEAEKECERENQEANLETKDKNDEVLDLNSIQTNTLTDTISEELKQKALQDFKIAIIPKYFPVRILGLKHATFEEIYKSILPFFTPEVQEENTSINASAQKETGEVEGQEKPIKQDESVTIAIKQSELTEENLHTLTVQHNTDNAEQLLGGTTNEDNSGDEVDSIDAVDTPDTPNTPEEIYAPVDECNNEEVHFSSELSEGKEELAKETELEYVAEKGNSFQLDVDIEIHIEGALNEIITVYLPNKEITDRVCKSLNGTKGKIKEGCTVHVQPIPLQLRFLFISTLTLPNKPELTTNQEVFDLGEKYGRVNRAFVMVSPETGEAMGYSFIEYLRKEDANRAKIEISKDSNFRVEWADCADTYSMISRTLFVEQLPSTLVDHSSFRRMFIKFGAVKEAILTGLQMKRRGYVEFHNHKDANKARKAMHNVPFQNQLLRVTFANPSKLAQQHIRLLTKSTGPPINQMDRSLYPRNNIQGMGFPKMMATKSRGAPSYPVFGVPMPIMPPPMNTNYPFPPSRPPIKPPSAPLTKMMPKAIPPFHPSPTKLPPPPKSMGAIKPFPLTPKPSIPKSSLVNLQSPLKQKMNTPLPLKTPPPKLPTPYNPKITPPKPAPYSTSSSYSQSYQPFVQSTPITTFPQPAHPMQSSVPLQTTYSNPSAVSQSQMQIAPMQLQNQIASNATQVSANSAQLQQIQQYQQYQQQQYQQYQLLQTQIPTSSNAVSHTMNYANQSQHYGQSKPAATMQQTYQYSQDLATNPYAAYPNSTVASTAAYTAAYSQYPSATQTQTTYPQQVNPYYNQPQTTSYYPQNYANSAGYSYQQPTTDLYSQSVTGSYNANFSTIQPQLQTGKRYPEEFQANNSASKFRRF